MTNPQTRTSHLRLVMPAVAVLSFGVLTFEIALTRIFSVMLSYHFVFAIVSSALLGLGLGGMLLKRWLSKLLASGHRLSAALFALCIAASVLLIITLPIYKAKSLASLGFWIYLLLATLPFFFAGLTLSEIFQDYAEKGSFIYAADLLGATLGALAVVPLLDKFGAVNTAILAAVAAAAGAVLLGWSKVRFPAFALGSLLVLAAGAVLLIRSGNVIAVPVAMDPNKEMSGMLNNPKNRARIVESRWSSFGRTDLVASELLPNEMTLFVDGAAGSVMYNLKAVLEDPMETAHLILHFSEFFPFLFLKDNEKDTALIIGPGGGRDVVVALSGGVKSITAVEVNPDVVQIVKDYESFNGGIYSRLPNVRAVVAEGRNFLRSSNESYDLIMLAIPVTKSSRSVEGYALTENYLFTVEAFEDYLNHLTPEGSIVIVAHNDAEIYRIISLVTRAMKMRGVAEQDAMKHIYTVGSETMPAIVIKNQPLQRAEAEQIHLKLHEYGYDQENFFVPFIDRVLVRASERLDIEKQMRLFDYILVGISGGEMTMDQLVGIAPFDISPVTDDRPFFYKLERGLPSPFGLFTILILGALGILLVLVFQSKPSTAHPLTFRAALRDNGLLRLFLLVFCSLGVGFMLIEIASFQRLMLFIGQPQAALTVLLFSLLLGTGLGSLASGLSRRRPERLALLVSIGTAVLILLFTLFFTRAFRLGLDAKLTAMALLVPLGFLMGFPFPLTVRLMKTYGFEGHVHIMWGINGIASVLGSALAMILGITFGFTFALALGALLYGCTALLFAYISRSRENVEE